MVQYPTPEECILKIKASLAEGADALGIQLCKLRREFRTKEVLMEIFAACEGKPIYVTSYRVGHSEGLSDDEVADLLLLAADCGANLMDVMGDLYGPDPAYQLTTDPEAVERQKALIAEIHRRGGEVLMSCHTNRSTTVEENLMIARAQAEREGLPITHYLRNSNDLFGIPDAAFDAVLCSMMLMDCEDLDGTLREVFRVLKPGGRLFASVLHPCFDGNHDTGIGRQGTGIDRQVVVMNYFEPKEWSAPLWGGTIPVIWRHRTLEEYVKSFIKAGLTIVDLNEPRADEETAKISTAMAWLQKIPLYMYWELRK